MTQHDSTQTGYKTADSRSSGNSAAWPPSGEERAPTVAALQRSSGCGTGRGAPGGGRTRPKVAALVPRRLRTAFLEAASTGQDRRLCVGGLTCVAAAVATLPAGQGALGRRRVSPREPLPRTHSQNAEWGGASAAQPAAPPVCSRVEGKRRRQWSSPWWSEFLRRCGRAPNPARRASGSCARWRSTSRTCRRRAAQHSRLPPRPQTMCHPLRMAHGAHPAVAPRRRAWRRWSVPSYSSLAATRSSSCTWWRGAQAFPPSRLNRATRDRCAPAPGAAQPPPRFGAWAQASASAKRGRPTAARRPGGRLAQAYSAAQRQPLLPAGAGVYKPGCSPRGPAADHGRGRGRRHMWLFARTGSCRTGTSPNASCP